MRTLIHEGKRTKVYQDGDRYELFALSGCNYDGWYEQGWKLIGTYTDVYHRDNLGRTHTFPSYNRNSEKGYAYKEVMKAVKYYEK